MTRAERIVLEAKKWVGVIEKPNNKGFWNLNFQKLMISVGFYPGAAWCAFFTKLVYTAVYRDNKALKAVINSCNTGGALDTLRRHEHNGTFSVGEVPKVGAIVVYRYGRTTRGHHGVVIKVDFKNNVMTTIDGNTNASGSREGDRVAEKLRTITRDFRDDGLNIEGYIYALED